jgi:F-type H+-transporting ATPase subunit delta
MAQGRIAHRYAEALITTADELHLRQAVSDDLLLIQRIIKESHDFVLFLKSPVINKEKKQAVFKATFSSAVQPLTFQFLTLLIEKEREDALPAIIDAFLKLQDENLGIIHVYVKTAAMLSQQQSAQLKERFESYSKKKVVIDQSEEKDLIGGFVARIGDTVFDGSVKQQLKMLRKRFAEEMPVA